MSWTCTPAQGFESARAAWDAVNRQGPHTPLLDSRFVAPLLAEFSAGSEMLAVRGGTDAPDTMAILCRTKTGVWSTLQPSQAPLGMWVSRAAASLPDLASELLQALPGMPLLVGVTQRDPDLEQRPQDDDHIRTMDYIQTARVTVHGSFEEYWSARGKNLRHNLKRQRNRLAKEGVVTRLEVVTEPGQMDAAVAEYGRIESGGWKTAGGTAIHADNPQGRFYGRMLRDFAESGEARVYRYLYDGVTVAMDLCLCSGGTLIILKTTYDESRTTTSPAMLMRQDAFARIFEEGDVKVIEFYGKLMDWHTKWTNEIRTMFHVNCYRWGVLAKAHGTG